MTKIAIFTILGTLLMGISNSQAQTFSFKIDSTNISANTIVDLTQQANPKQGANIEEPSLINPINLKGALTSSTFCEHNQVEFNIKNIICTSVDSEKVRLTLNTSFVVNIPSALSTLKFSLYSVVENVANGFSQVKVDGATVSSSPSTIPRFTNIGHNESGTYSVPIEIEMPFKGLNFKAERNSFLNFYLEVSDL